MLTLYIAMSPDGFIAGANDSLDFLSVVERPGQDYGYSEFIETIDAIIIGRKTYDKVLSMGFEYPHKDKDVYIISHTERQPFGNMKYYNGNLIQLVKKLNNEGKKNIFCDGGAEIVNELLRNKLIDEFIISVIPILLGDGVRLFKNGCPEQKLELISSKEFESGLLQVRYKVSDL